MSKYTEKELRKYVEEVYFNPHAHISLMIVTDDKQAFHAGNHSHAVAHASNNGGLKIFVIDRKGDLSGKVIDLKTESQKITIGAESPTAFEFNAKNTVAAIKGATTLEELNKVKAKYISEKENRATVQDALKAKEASFIPVSPETLADDKLILQINSTTTLAALASLDEVHGISKHDNEDVISAYDAKENELNK